MQTALLYLSLKVNKLKRGQDIRRRWAGKKMASNIDYNLNATCNAEIQILTCVNPGNNPPEQGPILAVVTTRAVHACFALGNG